ncbi:MAG: T9SS C-terminal target domain-containing protein, partial [Calditrichaeota bacterium]
GQLLDTTAANRLLITVAVENLDNLVVYPNPYHADRATQPLRFGNVPRDTEIRIFTAAGVPVRRLEAETEFGGVVWDLRTDQGHPVGSGVYIFIARHGEQEKRGKILVVR